MSNLEHELDGTGYDGFVSRKLIAHASVAFSVTAEDILGDVRQQNVVRIRFALMWVLRELEWSYPTIGRLLNKDHSSVINGVKQFQKALNKGKQWALVMRQELMAPGTIDGLHQTIDGLKAAAKRKIAEQVELTRLNTELTAARHESAGLRIQVDVLLKAVAAITLERDRLKQDS